AITAIINRIYYTVLARPFLVALFGIVLPIAAASQASAGSVNLQWTANTETDIAVYRIWYGTISHNYTQQINVGNITTTTVSNLTNGLTYFFAVTAYDTTSFESNP